MQWSSQGHGFIKWFLRRRVKGAMLHAHECTERPHPTYRRGDPRVQKQSRLTLFKSWREHGNAAHERTNASMDHARRIEANGPRMQRHRHTLGIM